MMVTVVKYVVRCACGRDFTPRFDGVWSVKYSTSGDTAVCLGHTWKPNPPARPPAREDRP